MESCLSLVLSTAQIGHSSALGDEFLIAGEGLENVGLAQREPDFAFVIVVAYD